MWLVILVLLWGLNLIAFISGMSTGSPFTIVNFIAMLGLSFAIGIELEDYR